VKKWASINYFVSLDVTVLAMTPLRFNKGRLVLWFLASALLCGGLVCYFYLIPLDARFGADRERMLVILNAQIARSYKMPGYVTNLSRSQYSGFGHLSIVLTDLQTTSSHSGLTVLDATSHPIETKEHSSFGEVQISTRMKGNYKDIKNVVSKLLAAHEGLSLDTLSFRRARATDPQLDAEVRMTFYYKKDA
jgi:hypothetical protein